MEASIQKYQALVETVRQGSFTAAADRLGYSQSGVSRMVADLERGWGVTLLERGRGGVRLTSDGAQLLPAIQSVCESERRLQMRVDDLRGLAAGIIRIGAFSSVATHWVPPVIKRFQADYPAIEYELLVGAFGEIRTWCEEGRVDLAFLPDYVRSDLLQTQPTQSGEYLAVLPEGHPLAKRKFISVERLAREPFILLEKASDRSVSEIFERAGVTPQVRFKTYDDYAIMSMVESGLGVAILPSLILTRNPYRIETVPLRPRVMLPVNVCYRSKEELPLAAERFLDYLDFGGGQDEPGRPLGGASR